MLNKKIWLHIGLGLMTMKIVLAYIDPGTGGMIVGSIWPFIVAVLAAIGAFFLRYFFQPIKKAVLRLWEKIKRKD